MTLQTPAARRWTTTHWILTAGHLAIWLRYLPSSFWLDECGTVWLTQGGFGDILRRTLLLLHTPLFASVASVAASVVGINEVALRLPSWIAIAFAIVIFWRLANELLVPETALAATAIFTTLPIVGYAAADARPYAFAIAALCASHLWFLRSLASGRPIHLLAFAISTSVLVHFHLLFIYALGNPTLYLLLFERQQLRSRLRLWLTTALGILILILPLLPYYHVMISWGSRYSFSQAPTPADLAVFLAPARPLLFFLFALILSAGFVKSIHIRLRPADRRALAFALVAALFPAILLFSISATTSARLFVPRYLTPAIPGIALFWGWVIGRIDPPVVRRYISLAALLATLAAQLYVGEWHHERDDWKGALVSARSLANGGDTPLVLYSGFMESASLDSLRSPEHRDYILAPVAAYPTGARTVVALPLTTDPASRQYWDAEFQLSVRRHSSFTAVLRGVFHFQDWSDYLTNYATENGYRLERIEDHGPLRSTRLLHFVRK